MGVRKQEIYITQRVFTPAPLRDPGDYVNSYFNVAVGSCYNSGGTDNRELTKEAFRNDYMNGEKKVNTLFTTL